MKKLILAILLILFVLTTACGRHISEPTAVPEPKETGEIKWKIEETKIPDADEAIKDVLPEGSDAFIMGYQMVGGTLYSAATIGADGVQTGVCIQKLAAPYTSWENYTFFFADTTEENLLVKSVAFLRDGSIRILVRNKEEQGSAYRLTWTQENGMEMENIQSQYLDNSFWDSIDMISYVDADNNVYFMTLEGCVLCFDEAYKEKKEWRSMGHIWQIAESAGTDGQIYFCGSTVDNKFGIYTMKSNDPVLVSGDSSMSFMDKVVFTGEGEGILCNAIQGIWNFELTAEMAEQVLPFREQGYLVDRVLAASLDEEENLFMLTVADDEYRLMKRVVDNTWQEKTVLEMAVMYADSYLHKAVTDFNQQSDKYYIELRERGNDEGYEDYMTAIQMEVSSGSGPDILASDAIDSYAAAENGYLRNLTLDFDGELGEMLVNLENYGLINGERYLIPYSFMVESLVVSKDAVGDKESWTTQEMMECIKAGGYEKAVTRMERYELFYLLAIRSNLFDLENGKCYMDSEEARALLEFADEYGKEDSLEKAYLDVAEGKTFAIRTYVSYIPVIEPMEKSLFEGKNVYIGYPVDNPAWESGNIMLVSGMAVNQACECPEGAVAFIKYLISKEIQDELAKGDMYGGLPVRKQALENVFRYVRENSSQYPQGFILSNMGFQYEQMPVSGETLKAIREVLQDARPETVYVDVVQNIIFEEAEAYYQGSRSAEEVCANMQQRIQLYFDERK